MFDKTSFAIANQDGRYYLNGLLFEFQDGRLKTVATDGHRLAICELEEDLGVPQNRQLIVPRKGVIELSRMLSDSDEQVELRQAIHTYQEMRRWNVPGARRNWPFNEMGAGWAAKHLPAASLRHKGPGSLGC